ncbi:uncharacterized protein LOC122860105 [Aphidius gifuensis]|uniref:uncharacterized protein LOC122860105 n=1 Tax=Aphidius gifuensis TaxID=684658 RepID=UPI001CDCCA23|nr:uncharacterized protein LOC122860105 [Aphidius gifuensis]
MVTFDQRTLDFEGFVGLGNHTPTSQKGQIGDHALVFMFQPFRGTWVQTLGCFLSKGATPSDALKELTLECIAKLEDAGLLVDAVTTDGASWNRAMWTKFNIGENHNFCSHPCDDNRKLWFTSDFPHLIKNLRNRILRKNI